MNYLTIHGFGGYNHTTNKHMTPTRHLMVASVWINQCIQARHLISVWTLDAKNEKNKAAARRLGMKDYCAWEKWPVIGIREVPSSNLGGAIGENHESNENTAN